MEEEHHPELIHREEGEVLSVGPVFPISHSTIETGPLNHPTNVLPPQGFVVGNLKPVSSNITSSFEVGSEPVLTMNRPMDMPPPENWRYWDPKDPHDHDIHHDAHFEPQDPTTHSHGLSSLPAILCSSTAPPVNDIESKEIAKPELPASQDHTSISMSSFPSGSTLVQQVPGTIISEETGNISAPTVSTTHEMIPLPESVQSAKIEPPTWAIEERSEPLTDVYSTTTPSESNPVQIIFSSESKPVEPSSDLSKSKKGFIASLTDNFKPETKKAWSQMFGYRYEDDVVAKQQATGSRKTNQTLTVVQENELLVSSRKAKLQMEKRLDQQIQEYQRKFQERSLRKQQQQQQEQTSRRLPPDANKPKTTKSKFVLPSPIENFFSPTGLRHCIERAIKQTCRCLHQMWSISTGKQVTEYQLEQEGLYVTKQELQALIHELFSVKSSRPQPLSLFANQKSTLKPSKLECLLAESCFIPFGNLTQLRNIVAFGTKIHLNEQKLMALHTALQRQLHLLPHSDTLQSFFITDSSYLNWNLEEILVFFRAIYVQLSRAKLDPPSLQNATDVFQLSPFDLTSKLQLTSLIVVQRILFFRFLLENLVKEKANPTPSISFKSKTSFSKLPSSFTSQIHKDGKDNDADDHDEEEEEQEEDEDDEEEDRHKTRGRKRGKNSVFKTKKQLKKKEEVAVAVTSEVGVVTEGSEKKQETFNKSGSTVEILATVESSGAIQTSPSRPVATPSIAVAHSTTTLHEEDKLKREKGIKNMKALKQRLESAIKRCDTAAAVVASRISTLSSAENNSTWSLQQVVISTNTLAASAFCDSLDKALHDEIELDPKIVSKIEKFILSLQTLAMSLHKVAAAEQISTSPPPPSYVTNKSETTSKPTTIYKLDTTDTTPTISSPIIRPNSNLTPRKIPTKLNVSTIEVPLNAFSREKDIGPKGIISTIDLNRPTPSGGDYEIGKSDALRFRKNPAFSFGSSVKSASTVNGQVPPKSPFKSPHTPVRKTFLNTEIHSLGGEQHVVTTTSRTNVSPRKNQATSTTEPPSELSQENTRQYEVVDAFLKHSLEESSLTNEDPEQEDEDDAEVRQALQDQKRVFMGAMLNDLLCPRPPSATMRKSSFERKENMSRRPSSAKNMSNSTRRRRPLKPRLIPSRHSSPTTAYNAMKIDWNRQPFPDDDEELDAEIFTEDSDEIQSNNKGKDISTKKLGSEIVEQQQQHQTKQSSDALPPLQEQPPEKIPIEPNDEHFAWATRISEMYKTKL